VFRHHSFSHGLTVGLAVAGSGFCHVDTEFLAGQPGFPETLDDGGAVAATDQDIPIFHHLGSVLGDPVESAFAGFDDLLSPQDGEGPE